MRRSNAGQQRARGANGPLHLNQRPLVCSLHIISLLRHVSENSKQQVWLPPVCLSLKVLNVFRTGTGDTVGGWGYILYTPISTAVFYASRANGALPH